MNVPGMWTSYQYNIDYMRPPQAPPNKYVYVKQNFIPPQVPQPAIVPINVHINPNFNKKVFVNPNFQGNIVQSCVIPKVHLNPNSQNIKLQMTEIIQNEKTATGGDNGNKIHINPNVLRTIPVPREENKVTLTNNFKNSNKIVYLSKTKLVRHPDKISRANFKKIRRVSICSNYKIIKSPLLNKKLPSDRKSKKTILFSPLKYKLVKIKTSPIVKKNKKYKLDNRMLKEFRDQEIQRSSEVCVMKTNTTASLLKIGNILYQKSPHSLKRTSDGKKTRASDILSIQTKKIKNSKYKFVKRKSFIKSVSNGSLIKRSNSKIKSESTRVQKFALSPGKLRKCNIPCLIYRKFGRCRAYEKGKCFKKHDPDQIALCTKFLQGACVNEKCLLSHNVSPEKMPTCKFYLEGSCSKDECPYLHVRISPKADICNDFLEGFCKKGKECDKRHQFLCPEFEKHGKCLKQRCVYPHGRMVRKYSVLNKDNFAKKSSEIQTNTSNDVILEPKIIIGDKDVETCDGGDKVACKKRYYAESQLTQNSLEVQTGKQILDECSNQKFPLTSRPKLGSLPSYIAFQDS